MLNEDLNVSELTNLFQVDQRVRISDLLKTQFAEQAYQACLNHVPYATHFVLDELYQSRSSEQMASMTPKEAKEIRSKIMSSASRGVGFLYQGYLKSRAIVQDKVKLSEELLFCHKLFEFIGSREVIDFVKDITGAKDITSVEPQFTRYLPGHFLTRHKDVVPNKNRKIAFVLSLTKDWHPDWGGLLQFYENNGTPRDSWCPKFNSFTLFDVKHIHSVTYVTPFAANPRLSLTGWFIAD